MSDFIGGTVRDHKGHLLGTIQAVDLSTNTITFEKVIERPFVTIGRAAIAAGIIFGVCGGIAAIILALA